MSDEGVIAEAAESLLANRHRHRTEGNVQSDLEALLRTIDVGTIESKYQIGKDQADIYLPNRRTFIEVKAYPKAADPEKTQGRTSGESPREQLDRYVLAEIDRELTHSSRSDVPWTGIVTDGSNWHVYLYPHQVNPSGKWVQSQTFVNESESLADFLLNTLGSAMVGKEWVPREPGDLFVDFKTELDALHKYLPSTAVEPTRTKKDLWLDMMRTSGMVPDDEVGRERLFLAHSFLIVIVRLVSHTLAHANRGDEWQSALSDGFASWVLDFERGERWADRVREKVDKYDWRRRRGDVLRELYHQYVEEQDRKVFGEFYTPDWLAELMVDEVLDDQWIDEATAAALSGNSDGMGILDPTCGSGTFLYHAALRILNAPSVRGLRPVERANVAARLVNGMDIHPVAVEIARVNLERALPAEPTEGPSAYRVFLGDSLQTATHGSLIFGNTEDTMRLTTPRGNQACIPMKFAMSPSFAENMRRMVNAAVAGDPLPPGIATDKNRGALESCQQQLREIVAEEGNSVWTWYAVNLAGPSLLSERKVDRIVANPPWVKLSDIQVEERKRAMEDFGASLELQTGGKQAPHLDIASFFILKSRELYAADPNNNPAVWLVKKSALRSGQWEAFRRKHNPTLAQSVDLQDLNPFHGGDATRCCLLFEHRTMRESSNPKLLAKRVGSKRSRLDTHESLASARDRFEFVVSPDPLPQARSDYSQTNIRQGATILPHVLAVVASKKNDKRHGWTRVRTGLSNKDPWDKVPSQEGSVPKHWIRQMYMSRDMLPYIAFREPAEAIIPAGKNGQLLRNPGRDCPFWRELNEIYDARRGRGRGTPETLIKQFDFNAKLSLQPVRPARGRRMLLYPKSADIMRAARTRPGTAVVNETLYWLTARNEAEAGYLVALLNAACLKRAFAESKESGRDFHLHPWRSVPIPRYDANNKNHRRLSRLCASAEKIAEQCVAEESVKRPDLGQIGLSQAVRNAVATSTTGCEIERIAALVLPNQAE